MVTIQFTLNEENINKAGHTVAQVENYLRTFYAKRNAIEIEPLTFQRDDNRAMCNLGDILPIMAEDPKLLSFLETCVWNVDGVVENCLEVIKNYVAKYGYGC